jgi:uncharacterized membrane protein
MELTEMWINIGNSEEVLEMGSKMKKKQMKLPPGEIGIFKIIRIKKENNSSTTASTVLV